MSGWNFGNGWRLPSGKDVLWVVIGTIVVFALLDTCDVEIRKTGSAERLKLEEK